MKAKAVAALVAAGLMTVSVMPTAALAAEEDYVLDEALDLGSLLEAGVYEIKPAEQEYLTVDCYEIEGVQFCTNVVDEDIQYMNIWIPQEYVNDDGTFNYDVEVNGYNGETAPIIFRNNCSGWFSSNPENDDENSIGLNDYMENGYIYVACGARSRNANNGEEEGSYESWGKAPSPIVDLKAGIRFLKANADAIPGDVDHIISIGGSGAGEMSSVIGATGDMEDYFPYLVEIGAAGITYDEASDTYTNSISDAVYACMAYYPITDMDNADIAYAWMRVNSGETSFRDQDFTEFQLALQEDEAYAFIDYINGLGLTDADGNALELTDLRAGSYYDAILNNMSNALNLYVAELSEEEEESYIGLLMDTNTDDETWIVQNDDGSYAVTDLDGFIHNFGNGGDPESIGEVFGRNKNIPGFDTLNMDAENNAFGYDDQVAVHYSATVAQVMQDNYDKYLDLMTDEEKEEVDLYIEEALTGDEASYIGEQTYLMNTMEMLFDIADGNADAEIAEHWRIRSGTADQHTAFTVGYNLSLAVEANDVDCDYSLVWAMVHGDEIEGTSTGTFVEWVNDLMQ